MEKGVDNMVLNLIQSLCLTVFELYNTPIYRVFKLRKIKNEISDIKYQLSQESIFDISDTMIGYLSDTTEEFKISHNIFIKGSCLDVYMEDEKDFIHVGYSGKFHRFNIVYGDNYFSFDVAKNINPPNFLKPKWNDISNRLFLIYMDILEDFAFELI